MKKQKVLIFKTLILIFFLAGCLPKPTYNQANTPEFVPDTPVPNSTSSLESNKSTIEEKCPNVIENIPSDLKGIIVLKDDGNEEHTILDLENSNIEKIPNSYSFVTSVPRDMLAYIDSSDPDYRLWKIDVIGPDGKKISLPRQQHWSDHLNLYQITNKRKLLINSDESYLLVNPFTGDEEEVASQFPDKKSPTEISQWTGPIYDPSMSFAIYPRNLGNEQNGGRIVLWNINSKEAISYISSNDVYGTEPKWAPDSSKFAMVLSQRTPDGSEVRELNVLNTKGQILQSTKFSATYPNSYITSYQWSPNSQKLAFWLVTNEPNNKTKMIVLDLQTGKSTVYCYSSEIITDPVWSPDSKWVLARVDKKHPSVISINIMDDRVIKFGEGQTPISWIVAP